MTSFQNFFTYGAGDFEKTSTHFTWNVAGNKVIAGDSTYNYYHTVLGISDMQQVSTLSVYPNPSADQITIETSKILSQGSLSIMDLNGHEVLTRRITQPKTQIDISSLTAGVYFVKLTDGKTVGVGRFVKQ